LYELKLSIYIGYFFYLEIFIYINHFHISDTLFLQLRRTSWSQTLWAKNITQTKILNGNQGFFQQKRKEN